MSTSAPSQSSPPPASGAGNEKGKGKGKPQNQGPKAQAQKPREEKPSSSPSHPPESDVPFIDTHCHLDRIFETDRHQGSFAAFKQRSPFPKNFGGAISIFCDPSAYSPSLGIWREVLEEPEVYGCFGIHPHNAKFYSDAIEERIIEALQHPKALAWGECGLDYHYNHSPREVQKEVFKRQLVRAVELEKPLVIHSREAEEDTLYILEDHVPKDWRIHMHCHAGSDEFTIALMRSFPNLVFGFTGALTFSKEAKKKVQEIVPLERIVLETDGPYMAPNPFRGKTAHPGHIPYIAQEIANLKRRSLDEVFAVIRENTLRMYGI